MALLKHRPTKHRLRRSSPVRQQWGIRADKLPLIWLYTVTSSYAYSKVTLTDTTMTESHSHISAQHISQNSSSYILMCRLRVRRLKLRTNQTTVLSVYFCGFQNKSHYLRKDFCSSSVYWHSKSISIHGGNRVNEGRERCRKMRFGILLDLSWLDKNNTVKRNKQQKRQEKNFPCGQ